jgi:hypothetical protein
MEYLASTWVQALERSLDAVKLIGEQASPPFIAGIPPAGIAISEAENKHHTVRTESRGQDVGQDAGGLRSAAIGTLRIRSLGG